MDGVSCPGSEESPNQAERRIDVVQELAPFQGAAASVAGTDGATTLNIQSCPATWLQHKGLADPPHGVLAQAPLFGQGSPTLPVGTRASRVFSVRANAGSQRRNSSFGLLVWLLICLVPRYEGLAQTFVPGKNLDFFLQQTSPADSEPIKRLEQLVRKEQWEEAVQLAEQLVEANSQEPMLQYWLGVLRWRQQDRTKAVQALRSAERLGLSAAFLHKTLGLVYFDLRQFTLFKEQMDKAIRADAGDSDPYFHLGRYFESMQHNFGRALECFDNAIRIKPDHVLGIYYKGYCLEMLGQQEQGFQNYQFAVQLLKREGGRFSWPYQAIARILLDRDSEQALQWAIEAAELEPDVGANHLVLAKIHERSGKFTEAIDAVQKAVRLNATDCSAYYMLFRLYKSIGKHEEALAQLKMFERLKAIYGEQ